MPAEVVRLTPAQRRVMAAAAAGHVKRSRWDGADVHVRPRGGPMCCGLSDGQNVSRQVKWLANADLIIIPAVKEGRSAYSAYAWTWQATAAGRAALGSPEATEKGRNDG
jgi:hypothetical protein